LAVQLVRDFGYAFNLATWESLTTPGTDVYQAAYGPLIIGEVIGNTLVLGGSLLLVLLFFKRKRAFPKVFVVLMIFSVAFIIADMWAVGALIKTEDQDKTEAVADIVKMLVQCAIWIPYMLTSRRVALTFTR
jgi:hypothetical protein